MQQQTTQVIHLPQADDDQKTVSLSAIETPSERAATTWVHRATGLIGGSFLFFALVIWLARPNHYRPLLILLTVAMFCAILHSYTFENGNQ